MLNPEHLYYKKTFEAGKTDGPRIQTYKTGIKKLQFKKIFRIFVKYHFTLPIGKGYRGEPFQFLGGFPHGIIRAKQHPVRAV